MNLVPDGLGMEGYAINVSDNEIGMYTQCPLPVSHEVEIKIFYTDGPGKKFFWKRQKFKVC